MKCFLCKKEDDEVRKFKPQILNRSKLFLKSRKYHNHKFSDVILPENSDDNAIGYHSSCYRMFYVGKRHLVDGR